MAKVTAADLKKHHYWILSGLAPLFAILAVLFLWLNVGTAVSKEAAETKKEVDAVKAVQPKGKKAIEEDYPKQMGVLAEQKTKLWQANYDRQKAMFDWPKNPGLQQLEARYPRFGQPIPDAEANSRDQIRKEEVYLEAYNRLAARVEPTAFAGGTWKSVLRHVSNWTQKIPTDKQVWLALEDLWVQRGLLLPVNDINAAASRFEPVKPAAGAKEDPLKRTFQSRIWTIELDVPKATNSGGQRIIQCRLTNRTDRLQVLGLNNEMRLLLTLAPGAPPTLYRIQSPLVPAGQTVEVKLRTSEAETPERKKLVADGKLRVTDANPRYHAVQPGVDPTGVLQVVQVLDARNAPVRRIDDVVLGARAKDARHSPATLVPPKWYPAEAPVAADAAGGMPGGPPGGRGMMPGMGEGEGGGPDGGMGGPGGMMGMGGPGGMMGMGGGVGATGKGGTPAAMLDGNKLRYIDVTDQVRRMPVALVLVIDQMFLQDALAAYANSTLRFQVTQFHWTRFRGTLDTPGTVPGAGGLGGYGPGGPGGMMPGGFGEGGSPDGDTGGGSPGGMGGYGGMMPGGMGGYGGMMGGGVGSPAVSEGQVTSGLVELSLYGIVTLYERYDVPAPTPAAPAGETPAGETPAAPPGSPASPAAATPTTGKQ